MHHATHSPAEPNAPYHWLKRSWLAGLFWLIATVALAEIECKPQYEANEPIVVEVKATEVPEGAKLRGSIQITDASHLCPDPQKAIYYVWAKTGKHTVTAQGVWALTSDRDVNGQKVPILVDFGQYYYTKTFVVGEGDDPVPPPPPPPPPGERKAVILMESEQRTPAEALLYQQLALELKPPQLQILDDDQPSAQKYLPLLPTSMSTVRPVMLVMAGEAVFRVVPLPSSVAAVKELMNQ